MKMTAIMVLLFTNLILTGVTMELLYREDKEQQSVGKFFRPPYVKVTDEIGNESLMPFAKAALLTNVRIEVFPGTYKVE